MAYINRGTAPSGRHVRAASWEAHRDFFRALFARDPSAVIVTGLARYDGAEDFERAFPGTRNRNVGSMYAPVAFGDLSIF